MASRALLGLLTSTLALSGVVSCAAAAPGGGGAGLPASPPDVPASPGRALVRGVLVAGGVICPLLQLVSGERVPLMGLGMDDHPPGTELTLEGHFVERSPCQQGGRTFRIERALEVRLPAG